MSPDGSTLGRRARRSGLSGCLPPGARRAVRGRVLARGPSRARHHAAGGRRLRRRPRLRRPRAAARLAAELGAPFPQRRPGSAGDAALADRVADTLRRRRAAPGGRRSRSTRERAGERRDRDRRPARACRAGGSWSSRTATRPRSPALAELSGTAALLELARLFRARDLQRDAGARLDLAARRAALHGRAARGRAGVDGGTSTPCSCSATSRARASRKPWVVPWSSARGPAPLGAAAHRRAGAARGGRAARRRPRDRAVGPPRAAVHGLRAGRDRGRRAARRLHRGLGRARARAAAAASAAGAPGALRPRRAAHGHRDRRGGRRRRAAAAPAFAGGRRASSRCATCCPTGPCGCWSARCCCPRCSPRSTASSARAAGGSRSGAGSRGWPARALPAPARLGVDAGARAHGRARARPSARAAAPAARARRARSALASAALVGASAGSACGPACSRRGGARERGRGRRGARRSASCCAARRRRVGGEPLRRGAAAAGRPPVAVRRVAGDRACAAGSAWRRSSAGLLPFPLLARSTTRSPSGSGRSSWCGGVRAGGRRPRSPPPSWRGRCSAAWSARSCVLRTRERAAANVETRADRTRGPVSYAGPRLARRHGVRAAAMTPLRRMRRHPAHALDAADRGRRAPARRGRR